MRIWTRRLLVGAIVGLLAGASIVPIAYAQQEQTKKGVGSQDEAYYFQHRQPLAGAPVPDDPNEGPLGDAGAIGKATLRDQTNVYARADAETLHVGVNAGDPETRSFIQFDLFSLSDAPLPPQITGGTVTLTNAPGPDRGNRNVEGAQMLACISVELVVPANGGDWDDMPEINCEFSSPLELVEGADPPAWTVELDPLAPYWADNENNGIAIVEASAAAGEADPSQTWHVAFWGVYNENPDAQPVTADLRFIANELPGNLGGVDIIDPGSDGGFTDTGGGFDGTGGGGFDGGGGGFDGGDAGFDGGFAEADPPDVAEGDMGDAEAPEIAMDEAAPPQTAPMEEQGAGGMPAVFLLPFLAVGLAGLLGYSLTQEPDLPEEREGAVSKLMRRQRAGGAPTDVA